jgi:hypothetical protein
MDEKLKNKNLLVTNNEHVFLQDWMLCEGIIEKNSGYYFLSHSLLEAKAQQGKLFEGFLVNNEAYRDRVIVPARVALFQTKKGKAHIFFWANSARISGAYEEIVEVTCQGSVMQGICQDSTNIFLTKRELARSDNAGANEIDWLVLEHGEGYVGYLANRGEFRRHRTIAARRVIVDEHHVVAAIDICDCAMYPETYIHKKSYDGLTIGRTSQEKE